MGGGGGFSIDVDDLLSPLVLTSTLKPRAPLDSRNGQRGTGDPCARTHGGSLSSSLSTTLLNRLAISLVLFVPSLIAPCLGLGVCIPTSPPSEVFFWPHVFILHTEGQ